MKDFEKMGVFYLGRVVDPATKRTTEEPVLYESKDLTTHAVCLGMTGSGKTGLGITILEEAALDKIPSIIIDPKGDLGNLWLTFPNLSGDDFLPWIDAGEAERKGLQPTAYAESVAKTWREGLAKWGETPERIQKLKDSVDIAIYTPASDAGIPISILSSFAAPPKELLADSGALRDRVMSLTSSLLGLLGIVADPIKSREHILISTIIDQAWRQGRNLDIAALIQEIQKPAFNKIGVLDIDTFYPAKDRLALSISLNNLLASPGFKAWMEGEPLDIQNLLYTQTGKPRMAILSIAHLSDSERMFFVTLLLNEFISWMRRQSGTSSLRALLYMDEIFGYFPPTAMPPSKTPMLTLLKQARAFGVGIVLATQNPVDLDYKGLSNCGTWFIGKLQTERDKARVLDGLTLASNGEIDSKTLDKMLASTKTRIFIMRSIHETDPILFETRWTMSYLRGPMTLTQIAKLTEKSPEAIQAKSKESVLPEVAAGPKSTAKPMTPTGIAEYFVRRIDIRQAPHYSPYVLGIAKLHFVDAKNKVDTWRQVSLMATATEDSNTLQWDQGKSVEGIQQLLEKEPRPNSTFAELPSGMMQAKNYDAFSKSFALSLYQNQTYTLYRSSELNATSNPGETEADFKSRLQLTTREKRDHQIQKVRDKYEKNIASLSQKIRLAQEKMSQKQEKAGWGKAETVLGFITTILGAIFGRGVTKGTINQAGTSLKRVGRATRESQDAARAEQDLQQYQQQRDDLQRQMTDEIATIGDTANLQVESIVVRPRKGDIEVQQLALVWWPTGTQE